MPTYLENALGVSPLVAGLALAALTLGWPLAASLSGRLFYLRLGFRPTVLIGLGLVVAGTGALALLAHRPSVAVVAVTCFVTGLGMGLVATPSLIAAQASVELARARRRDRHEHVRPVDGQRGGRGRPGRGRERGRSRRPGARRPTRSPRRRPEPRCSSGCWWPPC